MGKDKYWTEIENNVQLIMSLLTLPISLQTLLLATFTFLGKK